MDYKDAGVDTLKAQSYLKDLKTSIIATHKKSAHGTVIDNFGGFAGIFNTRNSLKGGHLVASTDGVGTKIELAKQFQYFDGLGYDLVAMCINDIYCVGATPLFFLDYVSCGKLDQSWYYPVIQSISGACEKTSIALLGGETAEHPGVMKDDDFDLAGFIVGIVEPEFTLPRLDEIKPGDLVFGFASSGLHSNGFSLVRKVLKKIKEEDPAYYSSLLDNREWVLNNILMPTRIYDFMPELTKQSRIKALAHITGGGIYENLARVLPPGVSAIIEKPEIFSKPIYEILGKYIAPSDMYHAFNMGIGMIAVASESERNILEKYGAEVIGKTGDAKGSQNIFIQGIDT
ncbi:MAG: phosphoribosylformylglycinamidine cyclo-ligase [Spirochaetia bacterium]|nr:phosphoribosylformylglycinamidine cyclo-ligase [Spirochaetia bacterium]